MPQSSNYFSSLRRLQEAQAGLSGVLDIRAQLAQAAATISANTTAQVASVVNVLAGNVRNVRRSLITVNTQLARQAQEDILAKYQEMHAEHAHTAPYRLDAKKASNVRYANGALESALADPEMVRGTYDGISLINTAMLNQRAKQWHRLNFGALPRGGGTRRFNVTWGDLSAASFGLDGAPSPAFIIPQGFWFQGPQGPEFYPRGELPPQGRSRPVQQATRSTRGVEAWNFLDAGVESVAKNLGEAYSKLFNQWVDESEQRGRGPLAGQTTLNITPGQITPSQITPLDIANTSDT